MNKKSRRFRNKTEAAAFIVITDSFILQKRGALYVKSSEMISDHLNLLLIKALSAYQKLMSNIIMPKGIFIGK